MELNTTNIIHAVFSAFAGEIAKQVSEQMEPRLKELQMARDVAEERIDRLEDRLKVNEQNFNDWGQSMLKLTERVARIEESGSALLALNLDDPGFHDKMREFVDDIADSKMAAHRQHDSHIDRDSIETFAADAARDVVRDELNKHESDPDTHHNLALSEVDEVHRVVREAFDDDDNKNKVIEELFDYHMEDLVVRLVDADADVLKKLADKLSASSPEDPRKAARDVVTEKLRDLLNVMHAEVEREHG